MAKEIINQEEKAQELTKYHALVVATIEYILEHDLMKVKTSDFDSDVYFKSLIQQAGEDYEKGRLTRLRQCFRDLTEMLVETRDFKFNQYLRDKTNYDIDIFKSFFGRIETIIEKGKITTDNQFYDVHSMVDQLSQTAPVDERKIEVLNKLLSDYEQRKSRSAK